MARERMIVLFDQSAKYKALPVGTGNKTERLLGYFTWHADDSPPINPLGDLFKTQVWQLARHLGVPEVIVGKPASADLIEGQTDEGDFGIRYAEADEILNWLVSGYSPEASGRPRIRPEESRDRPQATRGHALEAKAADRGDGQPDRHRRIVPEAGRLLTRRLRLAGPAAQRDFRAAV